MKRLLPAIAAILMATLMVAPAQAKPTEAKAGVAKVTGGFTFADDLTGAPWKIEAESFQVLDEFGSPVPNGYVAFKSGPHAGTTLVPRLSVSVVDNNALWAALNVYTSTEYWFLDLFEDPDSGKWVRFMRTDTTYALLEWAWGPVTRGNFSIKLGA